MIATFFTVLTWVFGCLALVFLFLLTFSAWLDPIPFGPNSRARWAVRLGLTLFLVLAMTVALTLLIELMPNS